MTGEAAIVGIGQTDMVRRSDESEWSLALRAILAATEDAGVDPREIDGILRYGYDAVTQPMIVSSLGIRQLSYYGEVGFGSLAICAVIGQAAMALASGKASVVLIYRAVNQQTGVRYGRAERHLGERADGNWEAHGYKAPGGAFAAPYGYLSPAQGYAMATRRYQYENGLSLDDLERTLGTIALAHRAHANLNPAAMMHGKPLTMDEYLAARMISTPLRLYDCCLESVGAAAVIMVRADRVAASDSEPVRVLAADQSMTPHSEPTPTYMDSLTRLAPPGTADRLYAQAGITPRDLSAAMLYDAFTPLVLFQLESYGLAPERQGWCYVLQEGLGPGSPLPVNTHGGLLSEGYIHGFNHVIEAVRQVRGTAAAQVACSGPVLVGGHMMSSVILGN